LGAIKCNQKILPTLENITNFRSAFRGQLQQNFIVLRDNFNAEAAKGKSFIATGANAGTPKKAQGKGSGKTQIKRLPRRKK
jgi:hypothetical protein